MERRGRRKRKRRWERVKHVTVWREEIKNKNKEKKNVRIKGE